MNIGIIGAGSVAQTLGKAWVKSGHKVMLSSRHPEDLQSLVDELGVLVGTPGESAQFGEVVLLALNYWTIESAIDTITPFIKGKLVIDATNPLQYADGGGTERVIEDNQIAGEVMQVKLPMARIAKAFTTLWTGYLEKYAEAEPRIAMTLAADQADDRALIAGLVNDVGFEPVELGSLADSRPLDPPSPIWNEVLTPNELRERVQLIRAQTQTGISNEHGN